MGWTALPIASGGVHGAVYGVSADGHVVVGYSNYGGSQSLRAACYWVDGGGPTLIGADPSEAYGVSADGSVIVGNANNRPFIWTAAGGMAAFGASGDNVASLSADGSRITGDVASGSNRQACYWDRPSLTRTALGFLAGHNYSRAFAVSADGTWIVGYSYAAASGGNTASMRGWRWSAATGMVDLGTLPQAVLGVRAFGVSNDGTLVAGDLDTGGNEAFRWTPSAGMSVPPVFLPTGASTSTAVSGDGTTIVGYAESPDTFQRQMCFWTASGITIPTPAPVDPTAPGYIEETYPTGVSADGRVIGGYTLTTYVMPWLWDTTDVVLVDPPGLVSGACGTPTTTSVTLQWTADPAGGAPASYNLRYHDATTTTWTEIDGLTTTSYTVGGLSNAASISWQVNAVNSVGESGWSETFMCGALVARPPGHQVFLEWSDDRGHSWSNPVGQTIGATGEYRAVPQWQRLGMARDRVFRISWSAPVPTALLGAYITADDRAKS